MKHILAGLGGMLLVAACVPVVTAPVPEPVEDACGAAGLQGLVGQSAAVLQTMRFGQETRILRPGMAVTMDFRPDRLNIEIDADERISRVYCT